MSENVKEFWKIQNKIATKFATKSFFRHAARSTFPLQFHKDSGKIDRGVKVMTYTEMLKAILEKLEQASFSEFELIYRFATGIVQEK